MRRALLLALAISAATPRLPAQSAAASCEYSACALNIVPRLYGLQVVRGSAEAPVAVLGFFWTRDISGVFDSPARDAARHAVGARRVAALLTDAGLALTIAGAARAARRDLDRTAANLMIVGIGTIGISVPVQFLADRRLSRAVWLHNARFAR